MGGRGGETVGKKQAHKANQSLGGLKHKMAERPQQLHLPRCTHLFTDVARARTCQLPRCQLLQKGLSGSCGVVLAQAQHPWLHPCGSGMGGLCLLMSPVSPREDSVKQQPHRGKRGPCSALIFRCSQHHRPQDHPLWQLLATGVQV